MNDDKVKEHFESSIGENLAEMAMPVTSTERRWALLALSLTKMGKALGIDLEHKEDWDKTQRLKEMKRMCDDDGLDCGEFVTQVAKKGWISSMGEGRRLYAQLSPGEEVPNG